MTKSLFLEAYNCLNIQNSIAGKELVLQSVNLNHDSRKLFLDRTIHIHVSIISTDRYGLDIAITLKKANNRSIRIDYHKKRTMDSILKFNFEDKDKSYFKWYKNEIHSSLFMDSLLSEVPSILSEYIYTSYNKKWNEIKSLCLDLIRFQSNMLSFDVNIETTNRNKYFTYRS